MQLTFLFCQININKFVFKDLLFILSILNFFFISFVRARPFGRARSSIRAATTTLRANTRPSGRDRGRA